MLSKHPEACRFPHGHTRRIEIVVSAEALDENDMVCDFKALKLALGAYVARYDHAMAVNSTDPLLPAIREVHPKSLVVFEGHDPTTEVIADELFRFVSDVLREGFEGEGYRIPPGRVRLDRVRVWETPNSWAEVEA
jgi:6-pyruvoyltetrahydropterin/6-carboxytetrahydropterin synthase